MLLSLISYSCHEITAVSKRIEMGSESIYDCFIIRDCTAKNIRSTESGGVIYMVKSNSKLQIKNMIISQCSAPKCGVFLVDNADIFTTENTCFSYCSSNDCSLGLSSGQQTITMSSVSQMSGISYVLQQKAFGHEVTNYNMSHNTGTTAFYIDRITKNNTISYSVLGNNTVNDAVYRSNSGNTYFNIINFIHNSGSVIKVEAAKPVYCLDCYFLGNTIDAENEGVITLIECYYSSGFKFIGTPPTGIQFHPDAVFPTNIDGLNAKCGTMKFPTGTPSPSVPENCVKKTLKKRRSILRVFRFISPAVLNCL